MPTAIQLSGITKSFDGFKALSNASFTAHWGEVHALLGENGAGKSSLMNIAAGLYAPDAGQIAVDDNIVQLKGPRDASRHRIGMVHQHFKLVKRFTVAENLLLSLPATTGSFRKRLSMAEEDIVCKAAELGFDINPQKQAGLLSIAEQQRVEILKVLMAGARIIILDEPTAVLTDKEAERLLQTVHALSRTGTAVLLVTHKMQDVKTYADQVTVMRGGCTIATVRPATVSISELVRLTVGESVDTPQHTRQTPGRELLAIRNLVSAPVSGRRILNGVNMTVRCGEIYGLAGVGGNGQSELANAIMGLGEGIEGEVHMDGAGDLLKVPTPERRVLQIAAIPADRYSLALATGLSIADNFGIGQVHSGRYGPVWKLHRAKLEQDALLAAQAFDVQGVRSIRQKAALLSGGNAQKLVIAREFSRKPRLVLAHSPSRGLDVRASSEVHARLLSARDAGAAVLMISEDLDEIMALADRIGVMARGRIVAEYACPADRQAIGQAMVDHD